MKQTLQRLKEELSGLDKVYIIVDGLNRLDAQDRKDFIEALLSLKQSISCMHLLLTSYDPDLIRLSLFAHHYELSEVKARENDLREFVDVEMKSKAVIHRIIHDRQDVVEEIATLLINKARGVFLLASLHLKLIELAAKRTVSSLRAFARDLSPALREVFHQIWSQVTTQNDDDVKTARQVLRLVAFAQQPLYADVVRFGLALANNDATIVLQDDLEPAELLIEPCKGLVMIQQYSKTVTFAHDSAPEFVPELLAENASESHYQISLLCLKQINQYNEYLTAGPDRPVPSVNDAPENYEAELKRLPLLSYALHCFERHARLAPELRLYDAITSCLQKQHALGNASILQVWAYRLRITRDVVTDASSPWLLPDLHLLTAMRLYGIVSHLIEEGADVNGHDANGWQAIRWALLVEDTLLVRLLTEKGTNLYQPDSEDIITLQWALGKKTGANIRYADVSAKGDARIWLGDSVRITPQSLRPGRKSPQVRTNRQCLEYLIDVHDLEILESRKAQVTETAAKNGVDYVVSKLLRKGVQPRSSYLLHALSGYSVYRVYSALHMTGDSTAVVGVNVIIDEEDWTSNAEALRWTPEDFSWILALVTSDTANAQDAYGRSVLAMAAEMGLSEIAQLLVKEGAEVNHQDGCGWTPLMWAIARPQLVKYRIGDCHFSGNSAAIVGGTVSRRGSLSSIRDPDPDRDDLWTSAKVGIVSMLLQNGADINITDKFQISIMQRAQREKIPGVVEALRGHQIDPAYGAARATRNVHQDLLEMRRNNAPNDPSPVPHEGISHSVNDALSIYYLQDLAASGKSRVHCNMLMLKDISFSGNASLIVDTLQTRVADVPSWLSDRILSLMSLNISHISLSGGASVLLGVYKPNQLRAVPGGAIQDQEPMDWNRPIRQTGREHPRRASPPRTDDTEAAEGIGSNMTEPVRGLLLGGTQAHEGPVEGVMGSPRSEHSVGASTASDLTFYSCEESSS